MDKDSFVYLLWKGKPVGTAKLFKGSGGVPIREIHGHQLKDFARRDEDLVRVYHVQIFQECEDEDYGFTFRGLEDPPTKLGDLNIAEKSFKSFIAWDFKQTVPNPHDCHLEEQPKIVSRETFLPITTVTSNTRSSSRRRWDIFGDDEDLVDEFLDRDGPGGGRELFQCTQEAVTEVFQTMQTSNAAEPSRMEIEVSRDDPPTEVEEVIDLIDGEANIQQSDGNRNLEENRAETLPAPRPGTRLAERGEFEIPRSAESGGTNGINCSFPVNRSIPAERFLVKRRDYVYRSRQKAPPKEMSRLRANRLNLSQRADNPFKKRRKCCKRQCFRKVDPTYSFAKYRKLMKAGPVERKEELIRFLNPESRRFRFDGLDVCSAFMETAFGFSRDLQSAVKKTPSAKVTCVAARLPRDVKGDKKGDFIITYLEKIAKETGDFMPNREQVQLPLMQKKEVYTEFKEYICREHPTVPEVPSLPYFYSIWNQHCSSIKTHRRHGFTVCDRCEEIREDMESNMGNERALAALLSERSEHLTMVRVERRGYASRRDKSITRPSGFYSIIVDGADQKSYGLPHFTRTTKIERGHKLKVKCVGVLEHLSPKRLHLLTTTSEFESGANHVIEAVHRVVNMRKAEIQKLPPVMYVQVDNCTRENKNRYFFAYFEMLVRMGVFLEVQICFLPVGHTHSDIDQSFSSVSTYLKANKAITMNDLVRGLGECYTPRAVSAKMDKVANFSGLCTQSSCLTVPRPFSHFRYFKFTRDTENTSGANISVKCAVKLQIQDEWRPLQTTTAANSFLSSVPNLRDTPPTRTRPPDDVTEINRHFQSVEGRIRSADKMEELISLKNSVYTQRVDSFHWDLETAFELNGDYVEGDTGLNTEDLEDETVIPDNYSYQENSFVAIKPDGLDGAAFWIARVIREERTELRILWHIPAEGSQNEFDAKYEPATVLEDPSNPESEHVLFYDSVPKAAVMVSFGRLSAASRLYCATKKAIRSALDLN